MALTLGRRRDRLRSLLRKIALVVVGVVLALVLTYTAFRRWTLMTPPSDDGPPLPAAAVVSAESGTTRMTVGENWMSRQSGIWRMHLSGGPREMGHAHGLLAGRITADIDRHMAQLMRQYVTSSVRLWLVENLVRWRFRQIPEMIPPRRLVELAAYSRTIQDVEPLPEQPFQRLIFYHALHDMTQRLDGSPIIGCTAFAAWGKQSVDGHMIVARNFDFEGGAIFDLEKAVIDVHTPGRIPFVSVAWPGMMGVVTGVNAKRLYVSINAARTDEPLQPGIPMAFLVREILERASNIKEALAVIKGHKVMVAENILIADGKVPKAVVAELSPGQLAVRRSPGGMIGLTNHFLAPKFKADASNDRLRRYTTSDVRYRRLTQLLKRFGGRFDPKTAALIMRNRTALNDDPLGLGNRNAIDALIATHGVVVDLSAMVLWVSKGPHLIGAYEPFDLKGIFGIPVKAMQQLEEIPADTLKDTPELIQHEQGVAQMTFASKLAKRGKKSKAMDYAVRAVGLMPSSTAARKLLADLLWETGARDRAKKHYRRFLELKPPYMKEQEVVKGRLVR